MFITKSKQSRDSKSNKKEKPELSKDYFMITRLISLITKKSNSLVERGLTVIIIMGVLSFFFLFLIDKWFGLTLLKTPTFILIVIWVMISPIIIDIIEYQIERLRIDFEKIIHKEEDKNKFKDIIDKFADEDSNMVYTAFLTMIITLILLFLIPTAVGQSGILDTYAWLFLTILTIIPSILISNMVIISARLITSIPEICELNLNLNQFESYKLKDLGGISSFVLTSIFLISSISLFIPHTVYQLQGQLGHINKLIPMGVMFLIIMWISIILVISLYHIHKLVIRVKNELLEKPSKRLNKKNKTLQRIKPEEVNDLTEKIINVLKKQIEVDLQLYNIIKDTPEWPFDKEAVIGIISSIAIPILTLILSLRGYIT